MADAPPAALLLMDFQQGVVDRYPGAEAVEAAARAASKARANGILVVFVRVSFRPGYPEISPRNLTFSRIAGAGGYTDTDPSRAIVAGLAVAPDDVVVVKRRVSAFTGSDLEVVLRSRGIQHLVLAGIATSGVVLSTLREAADRDYRLTVLADACTDADPEVHRVLTEKVFPRQAEVTTVDGWTANPASTGPTASS
jgi:nicotinamidase-related amidase